MGGTLLIPLSTAMAILKADPITTTTPAGNHPLPDIPSMLSITTGSNCKDGLLNTLERYIYNYVLGSSDL